METFTDRLNNLTHEFKLVVPVLDGYAYGLFNIRHDARLYPLQAAFQGENDEIASQEELINWLKQVFGSAETRRVLSSLVAQAKA